MRTQTWHRCMTALVGELSGTELRPLKERLDITIAIPGIDETRAAITDKLTAAIDVANINESTGRALLMEIESLICAAARGDLE